MVHHIPLANPDIKALAGGIPKSFQLGSLNIYPNVLLSSMHGVTDLSFRRLITYITGGRTGTLVTEFISASELLKKNPKSLEQMRFDSNQKPFGIQIYGGEPDEMYGAAQMAEAAGADYVEINSGCPAPRVVRKQCGSGLLKDLNHFREVVASVVKAVSLPVSVKVRIGYFNSQINVLEANHIATEEGAKCFIIHGRTREQGYKGFADWNVIEKTARQSGIPVVGNGDVLSLEDAVVRLNQHGVQGVSLGRGAMHNPFLFSQVLDLYEGREVEEPSSSILKDMFLKYHEFLLEDFKKPQKSLGRLKQLAARVLKGFPQCIEPRNQVLRSESVENFFSRLDDFFANYPVDVKRALQEIKNLNGRPTNEVE